MGMQETFVACLPYVVVIFHCLLIIDVPVAISYTCDAGQMPIYSRYSHNDFTESLVLNSSLDPTLALSGSSSSMDLSSGETYEIIYNGGDYFKFHSITLEVKNVFFAQVAVYYGPFTSYKTLLGIATDTSVFETVVISDSGIPVEDAKKIGITYFPAGGTTVYMQGVDIHACVGCQQGYLSLGSLHSQLDFSFTTYVNSLPGSKKDALKGSGTSNTFSNETSLRLKSAVDVTAMHFELTVSGAAYVIMSLKHGSDVIFQQIINVTNINSLTQLIMDIPSGGVPDIDKFHLAFETSENITITELFSFACYMEITTVATTTDTVTTIDTTTSDSLTTESTTSETTETTTDTPTTESLTTAFTTTHSVTTDSTTVTESLTTAFTTTDYVTTDSPTVAETLTTGFTTTDSVTTDSATVATTSQYGTDSTFSIATQYTSTMTEVCPSGLSILYAKYDDIDFDIYMDNNLAAVDPHLALEGSNTNITINENNTYHVNKSILGIPYILMEVHFQVRGADSVVSGALNYNGYISEMISIASPASWTSVNLQMQDGGFPDIHEVILEWHGTGPIDICDIYVLACKAP